ncbi:hypothetical protein NSQ38_03200 [Paenibacillus sp. FSL R7-0313]|uniref:hypothetical protein n=1 Tax=Paenibacillus sp. FSL R7-0313 TaxID=2954532 RepID=UPI0030DCA0CC
MFNEKSIAETAFHQDFSPILLGHTKLAILHGYMLAGKCVDDNDFLKAFVGKRNRSQLENTAVEFAIKNRAERFGLEITVEDSDNSRGTFPHYKFSVGKAIFTVSRTQVYDALPREAGFRSINSGLNSQMEMINKDGYFALPENFSEVDRYYGILTFGGRASVDFMHLGIPNSDIDRWLYQCNIASAISPVEKQVAASELIQEGVVAAVKDEFIKRQEVSGSE